MPRLERLRAGHHDAVLAFERDNRAYFATSISDRGDEFFDHFTAQFGTLLADHAAGTSVFHVLVDEQGEVLGRFNLYDLQDGAANVGYRVAQHVAGHGVATAAVRDLCVAAAGLGLHTLVAATAHENVASRRVLVKAGFLPDGPAEPTALGGKQGVRYRRRLAPPQRERQRTGIGP